MKKIILIALFAAGAAVASAQTTNKAITEHDPAVRAKDSTIKAGILDVAVNNAGGEAPDWNALSQQLTKKYDATTADRTVTKSKIYFSYSRDWPGFCAAIVHYTDHYELADDYKLLNKNAGMILQNSSDQSQLKEALKWSKAAMDSEPANAKYKATYDALTEKIK